MFSWDVILGKLVTSLLPLTPNNVEISRKMGENKFLFWPTLSALFSVG